LPWEVSENALALRWIPPVDPPLHGRRDAQAPLRRGRLRGATGRDPLEEAWELELDLGEAEKLLSAPRCEAMRELVG
jgi:hypothetical protein